MPSHFTFRFSTYLTLALACFALGYSEWDLLPEVTVYTAIVLMLMAVSFVTDGKLELNIEQANRMGMFIGVIGMAWLTWQMVRPSGGLVAILPWPASLLPYLGPLLMVLMPAKLFRPKHAGDWWAMQGIGLAAIGLASAITDDEIFGGLVIAYGISAVWSLSLFYWHRGTGAISPVPGSPTELPLTVIPGADPQQVKRHFRSVVRWSLVAGLMALPMFFLTPVSPGAKWQLTGKSQMETGLPLDPVVDLNRVGELKVNRDVAFEVYATFPEGGSKDDLSPNTYWRAAAYSDYEHGRWTQNRAGHLFAIRDLFTGSSTLPDLGAGQYFLDYRPTAALVKEVVAEPLIWAPGQAAPIISIGLTQVRPWRQLPDGTFVPLLSTSGRIVRYRQVSRPSSDPELGPPHELVPSAMASRSGRDAFIPLREARLPRIREWSSDMLKQFVEAGKLPPGVLDRVRVDPAVLRGAQVAPEDYEKVAKMFRDYFARSGNFKYGLKLSRQDTSLDPIEDFLFNTREGHCERFASALALTLRTLGIPCTFVLGYHGCDYDGEGKYVVRQEHAHAWVAVLIPRPTPPDFSPNPRIDGLPPEPPAEVWHWLTVDPTPSAEESQLGTGPVTWWDSAHTTGRMFYNDFIIGYDAERRKQIRDAVATHFTHYRWWYAAGIAAIIGLILGTITVRRWPSFIPDLAVNEPSASNRATTWYAQAIAALTAIGFPMRVGQTPWEYATATIPRLREIPNFDRAAEDLDTLTRELYRVRYAGGELDDLQLATLAETVSRLVAIVNPKLVGSPSPEVSHA